jgi:hypothetical protein
MSRAEQHSRAASAERFGPDIDDGHEEDLRTCRLDGHDFDAMVNEDGRESLACRRCDAIFEEVE